jgi:hypothetical protein
LFDFLNQIKSCVCCIHADASWCFLCAKGFKNAFRSCPNPSENFPDFSGIYSYFSFELFLLIKWLLNLFHELQTLYLDSSCPIVSLGIFLEFLGFSEYFLCLKNNFWTSLELFSHLKQIQKKRENLSYWAEPLGPTRSNSAQPPGPPEPIRARQPRPAWPSRRRPSACVPLTPGAAAPAPIKGGARASRTPCLGCLRCPVPRLAPPLLGEAPLLELSSSPSALPSFCRLPKQMDTTTNSPAPRRSRRTSSSPEVHRSAAAAWRPGRPPCPTAAGPIPAAPASLLRWWAPSLDPLRLPSLFPAAAEPETAWFAGALHDRRLPLLLYWAEVGNEASRFAISPLKFVLIYNLDYTPCIFFMFSPRSISFLQTDPTEPILHI